MLMAAREGEREREGEGEGEGERGGERERGGRERSKGGRGRDTGRRERGIRGRCHTHTNRFLSALFVLAKTLPGLVSHLGQ